MSLKNRRRKTSNSSLERRLTTAECGSASHTQRLRLNPENDNQIFYHFQSYRYFLRRI